MPESLEQGLRQVGPADGWCWSTREIEPIEMYLFRRYPRQAMRAPIKDYVAVSHAGHGVNSFSINYHLVYGPLALFAQSGWGGVYMDPEQSTARVNEQLSQCAELVALVDDLKDSVVLFPGRLIALESTFRVVRACGWLTSDLTADKAADHWAGNHQVTAEPLIQAARLLRELRPA